ncbi:hypothetical protein K502DRAFT_288770 [Neoconidiobolus thromboides FSU 785]|nr:hypothetical protein K502DRAFT_288770 [Neoconidiobolus thromboides FSU 785]
MINRTRVPEFMLYIDTLLAEIQIKKLTAVICLIYCERLKNRLPSDAKGTSDTIHRIFTASLLLACKYTTEPYNNRAVSKASKIYSIRDINNMEFEFLTLIDYEIWITKEDICSFMTENSEGLYIIGELN